MQAAVCSTLNTAARSARLQVPALLAAAQATLATDTNFAPFTGGGARSQPLPPHKPPQPLPKQQLLADVLYRLAVSLLRAGQAAAARAVLLGIAATHQRCAAFWVRMGEACLGSAASPPGPAPAQLRAASVPNAQQHGSGAAAGGAMSLQSAQDAAGKAVCEQVLILPETRPAACDDPLLTEAEAAFANALLLLREEEALDDDVFASERCALSAPPTHAPARYSASFDVVHVLADRLP